MQKLDKEHKELSKCLKVAEKKLQTESVQHLNCQINIKSLREELEFNAQVHKQVYAFTVFTEALHLLL